MNVSYEEAKDRLTLADVWDMAPNPNNTPFPRSAPCVVKSPLRPDHKGASFSIGAGFKVFKDHADDTHKGGVYAFIALCRPEWGKREIVRAMITQAGGDPDQKDPTYKKPSIAEWRAKKEKAAEDGLARWEREQLTIEPIKPELVQDAPGAVRGRYDKGLARAATDEWQAMIATERGWPIEWVAALVSMGRMASAPKGDPMFAVEKYCHKSAEWGFCGIHGRWMTDDGRKMWSYLPCMKWSKQETCALPFVLGRPGAPVWVVTEGQWDAATVYGMLGGFGDHPALDVMVFGIRGASGINIFMAHWAPMIRKFKPTIVLLPDADAAAKGWTEDQRKQAGTLPRWSFARRLRAVFKVDVVWMKCPAHKDINDWWASGELTADAYTGALLSVSKI